jgi:hypothetical protein
VGAEQYDRAGLTVSRDHRLIEEQRGSGESVGVQCWLGGVLEPASGQDEKWQRRAACHQTLAEQAVVEFHANSGGQVLQVELVGDAGGPQPQPVWVRIWGEPSAQDVTEHGRSDDPGATPAPHGRLIDRLGGGEVEQFPAGNVVDQCPLDVRQRHSASGFRDHAVTIGANGLGVNDGNARCGRFFRGSLRIAQFFDTPGRPGRIRACASRRSRPGSAVPAVMGPGAADQRPQTRTALANASQNATTCRWLAGVRLVDTLAA